MDFLSIVEEFVHEVAGKDAVKLFQSLKSYENISEFILAEQIKISINQVRNLLYKLNAHNLVYSTRKKDREKGWYIYYWTFNFKHARDILITRKEQESEKLKIELDKERQHKYFVCPNDGIRMELEEALENDYKCLECGAILKQEDSSKKINEIELRIHKLNSDLEELKKPMLNIPKLESFEEESKVKVKKHKKKSKVKKKVKRLKKQKKKNKKKVKVKKHKKKGKKSKR